MRTFDVIICLLQAFFFVFSLLLIISGAATLGTYLCAAFAFLAVLHSHRDAVVVLYPQIVPKLPSRRSVLEVCFFGWCGIVAVSALGFVAGVDRVACVIFGLGSVIDIWLSSTLRKQLAESGEE